jgi:hypothetical protein
MNSLLPIARAGLQVTLSSSPGAIALATTASIISGIAAAIIPVKLEALLQSSFTTNNYLQKKLLLIFRNLIWVSPDIALVACNALTPVSLLINVACFAGAIVYRSL